MLYRLEEWQSSSGFWYCEHTASHPKGVQKWLIPARMMNMTADKFIEWLIKNYNPDTIFHNEDCSFVGWGWKNQSTMRSFKNKMNALARELNYQI